METKTRRLSYVWRRNRIKVANTPPIRSLPPSWSTFVTTQNFSTNTILIELINCIRQEAAMKKAHRPEQT